MHAPSGHSPNQNPKTREEKGKKGGLWLHFVCATAPQKKKLPRVLQSHDFFKLVDMPLEDQPMIV